MRKLGISMGLLLSLGCPAPGLTDGGLGGGGEGGGSGGGVAEVAGGGSGGGAVAGDGGGDGLITCTLPARLEQLNGRFAASSPGRGPTSGFIDPQTRRLFVWPSSVSSSMKSLVTVRLVGAGTTQPDGGPSAFVEALPVTGEIPTGSVTASTFDPVSGRSYALILATNPYRYEVESFAFTNGGVHFTRHASAGTIDAGGPLMRELGVLGNQLAASRGNGIQPITISENQAVWGTLLPGNPFSEFPLYDSPNHRWLGVGAYQVTATGMPQWIARVKSRGALDPGWTEIAISGMGPAPVAPPDSAQRPYLAFDKFNNRLLVTSSRMEMIMGFPTQRQILFEANLQTNGWSFIGDLNRPPVGTRPFATDPRYPQVFDSSNGEMAILSLARGSELVSMPFVTSGSLPPLSRPTAAARLPDGRVLATVSTKLYLFDPPTRGWTVLAALPPGAESAQSSHTLTLDPANNRVLLFGGQNAGVPTNKVFAIALGTFAVTELTTGTPPAARSGHSAIVLNGQLIIAGGSTNGTTGLSDVWALDLTSLAWRKLGDVSPRSKPGLVARENEVWVIGGSNPQTGVGEPSIWAIDVTTGVVRSIAVQGAWPSQQGSFRAWAAAGSGLVVIDSSDTVDSSKNQLWELTFTGSVAQWRNTDPDAMDDSLDGTVGVSGTGCEDALFLGPSTFQVRRQAP